MKAPDKVKRLEEAFDRNMGAYKSSGYKEANVRAEFIDPFFEALDNFAAFYKVGSITMKNQ